MIVFTLHALGVGLVVTAIVNTFIQLYANNACFKNSPCHVPGPFNGSMDSLYEEYANGIIICNNCCGVPSSILFLISGILCIAGPVLGVLISTSVTAIFQVMIITCATLYLGNPKCYCITGKCEFRDKMDWTNWGFNFGAPIVGIILAVTASICSVLQMLSSE